MPIATSADPSRNKDLGVITTPLPLDCVVQMNWGSETRTIDSKM